MFILWIILGFIIGWIAAWFYFDRRHRAAVADREEAEAAVAKRLTSATPSTVAAGDSDQATLQSLRSGLSARERRIAELERELAAAPAARAPLGAPDDLTKIKGIGPVLKRKLNDLGIITFRQIADFTPDDIARVNGVLDFPGRIEREKWVEQAKTFVGD